MTFRIYAKEDNSIEKEILLTSFNTKKHQTLELLYTEGVELLKKKKIKGYVSRIMFGWNKYEYTKEDRNTYFNEYIPHLLS